MTRNALIALPLAATLAIAAAGCGGTTAATGPAEATASIAVDASLTRELQARQQAVRDALSNLLEGYPPEKIQALIPRLKFDESQARFLEDGKYLVGWSFNGRPVDNDVPVRLRFASGDASEPREVERVYVVKIANGRTVITRK